MTNADAGSKSRGPSLEERPLTYEELAAHKGELSADALVLALRDGRALVRANAALGLAAIGFPGADLIPFLRDSELPAAQAAAQALVHLGAVQRAHLGAIGAALDGARPEVVRTVVVMFAELIGKADTELLDVLDTSADVAAGAVIDACERIGLRGLHLLQAATKDRRARVRVNAVRGVGQLAHLEPVTSIAVMKDVAETDDVSDVRAGAQAALAAYIARVQVEAASIYRQHGPVPPVVPAMHQRGLTPDELKAAATNAPLDELLRAIIASAPEVRMNAVRVLALQGSAVATAAPALAVATRDVDRAIRLESVRTLAALGADGAVAAAALVRALGDADPAVCAAAEAALAGQGEAAAAALVDGLAVASELHGARVAALIGKLPDGAARLRAALASTAVDVRVNAALGLGALGKDRAGAALPALIGATRGGNARVRAAVAAAIGAIEPRPDRTPPAIAIDGFEQRALTEGELAKHKDALAAAGLAGLLPRLADARPAVRANATLGLGVIGGGPDVIGAIAVGLRDDDAAVRLSAAHAIGRLGEGAVAAAASALVQALRGAEPALTAQLTAMLRSADPAVAAALVRGLDTDDLAHGSQVAALVCARPDGVDLLCEAFERAGAQANVARAFVALGKDKLGQGRALLEKARIGSAAPVRELARATLHAIDGEPPAPVPPAIAGFDTTILERAVFAKVGTLDAGNLASFLADARPVVRANAATALGVFGAGAAGYALAIAALLRDDDDRVKVAAAGALDQLGDDAVIATAPQLVGALRGDPRVAEVVRAVLAARGGKVGPALVAGLDTSDEVHGARVAELVGALPDGRELLFTAFDGEAQNVQINAAHGIAKLGAKKAGPDGRRRLQSHLPGPPTRRRAAMVRALALLDAR